MEVQRKQWLCPGGCGPTRDTVGLICYANWLLPICTGPSNVLHYTPFICCDLIMETDLVPAAVALIWQWLLRKMEFVPFLAPTLFSQEGAMGIFQRCLLDWDWHPFDFLHWTPPSLPPTPHPLAPKESAFMSWRQDYKAVETERFNQWEWQCLGCNRAYILLCLNELVLCLISLEVQHLHSVSVRLSKVAVKTTICHIC